MLYERVQEHPDQDGSPLLAEYHYLVECMGCESIKYVNRVHFHDPEINDSVSVYPDAPGTKLRRPAMIRNELDRNRKLLIPASVWKMYNETLNALNADIRTLAGGGLRAMVEAICTQYGMKNGNLEKKIDELAKRNMLTTTQAELLHQERFLGNYALHEMETPSLQDLEDGIGIVEGLMNTIFILPSKAERLKENRKAKKKSLDPIKKVPATGS